VESGEIIMMIHLCHSVLWHPGRDSTNLNFERSEFKSPAGDLIPSVRMSQVFNLKYSSNSHLNTSS